jgi:hypothetical protein
MTAQASSNSQGVNCRAHQAASAPTMERIARIAAHFTPVESHEVMCC